MNKEILKAIMNRTRLRRKLWKSRSIEDELAYNKNGTLAFLLIDRQRETTTTTLIIKKAIDNKSFWKFVKPQDENSGSFRKSSTLYEYWETENNDEWLFQFKITKSESEQ